MIGDHTVTLIAALHNAEPALERFLAQIDHTRDVLDQVVLIDDGSADGTWERITAWKRIRTGPTVTLRNATNIGVAASRNAALQHATGDFVWFVDHDDQWNANTIRRLTPPQQHIDVLWFRAEYRTHPGQSGRFCDGLAAASTVAAPTATGWLLTGAIDGFLWSKLFRRSAIPVDPFPLLSSQSDIVGVTRILARTRYVQFVPQTLYHWLHRPGSITRTRTPNLDNLAHAHALVLDALPDRFIVDVKQIRQFTAWFCCRAMIITPIRAGAGRQARQDGFARARRLLPLGDIVTLVRTAPVLAALLGAARISPTTTTGVLRCMYAALDRARVIRGGPPTRRMTQPRASRRTG